MYTIERRLSALSGEKIRFDVVPNYPESKRVGACISMYGPSGGDLGTHIGVDGEEEVLALLNAIAVESGLIRKGERISVTPDGGCDTLAAKAMRAAEQALLEVREIGRRLDNV